MPNLEHIQFADRNIYLATGRISQTVNICTKDNKRGEYDWIIRLPVEHFIVGDQIREQSNINDLVSWLTSEKLGQVERSPAGINIESPEEVSVKTASEEDPQILTLEDAKWIERAMKIVEICINELILEFIDLPYLHRVEHSIHTRLYSILRNQPHFDRHFLLGEGQMLTQPIHKEWPETIPRPEKGNRRGSFDLAILSPGQMKTCTLKNFSDGRLDPAIVIEMGLNYKEGHLSHDAEKLLNSNVEHGYLVHLVREKPHEKIIDQTIDRLRSENTIKVAFARVEKGNKFIKLLDDPTIREL